MDEQEDASNEERSVVVHPCLEGGDKSEGENLDGDSTSGANALKDELRGDLEKGDSEVKETLTNVELVLRNSDILEKGLQGKRLSVCEVKGRTARECEKERTAVRQGGKRKASGLTEVMALEMLPRSSWKTKKPSILCNRKRLVEGRDEKEEMGK
jgi:hypothetical protein